MLVEYDRDKEHLDILGIIFYIKAGIAAFMSFIMMLYAIFFNLLINDGGIFECFPNDTPKFIDPEIIPVVFASISAGFICMMFLVTLLLFLTGRFLRSSRHRIFCFIMAILCLFSMPWGTVLGIFTLIVLNRDSVVKRFENEE